MGCIFDIFWFTQVDFEIFLFFPQELQFWDHDTGFQSVIREKAEKSAHSPHLTYIDICYH